VLKILVVEDDPGVQTLLNRILSRRGFAVECACDGAEALNRLAAHSYDVVLLDLAMPKVSGIDVLRRLEEDGRADLFSRIIVVTAASTREIARLSRVKVLRKPFDLDELMAAINRTCRSRTGADESSRDAART
jgi:DNA-binding response OmpR family regulator